MEVEVVIPIRRSAALAAVDEDSQEGVAGPGPETMRNQRGLAPVPQPSPSAFRPYLREETEAVNATSQLESIKDFSSPARGEETKPRVGERYTLVDGEEALVASDSDDDDIEILEREPTPRRRTPSLSPRLSIGKDGYKCRWDGCKEVLPSPVDLGRHIRIHAEVFDQSDETASNSPQIPSNADDGEKQCMREEIEELQSEAIERNKRLNLAGQKEAQMAADIEALKEQLQAATEKLSSQVSPQKQKLSELEQKLQALEHELEGQKSAGKAREDRLKDVESQYQQASERCKEVEGELRDAVQQKTGVAKLYEEAQTRQLKSEELLKEAELQLEAVNKQRQEEQTRRTDAEAIRAQAEERQKTAEARLKEEETKRKQQEETIAELSKRTKELEAAQTAPAAAPVVSGPPPATDGAGEQDQISELTKQLKKAKKSLSNTRDDYEYIKAQYDIASGQAVTATQRVEQLETQVEKLQTQLTLGLKQREMFNLAVVEQYKTEAMIAKQQLELVQEQNRRTDDKVRLKASLYKPTQREKEALELELHKARDEANTFKERNDELVEQVALLRARLMGAFDDPDPEPESEAEMTPSPSPQPQLQPLPTFAPDDESPLAVVRDTCLAEGGIEAFRCKWAIGEGFCPEILQTREVGLTVSGFH